jgi:hypothetical protein
MMASVYGKGIDKSTGKWEIDSLAVGRLRDKEGKRGSANFREVI